MGRQILFTTIASTLALIAAPALAQDGTAPVNRADMIQPQESTGSVKGGPEPAPMEDMAKAADAAPAAPVLVPIYKTAADGSDCELHVWPTENYLGIKLGLLSGFGPVGVLADIEASKGKVRTVKDLMRDYLGPDVQMQELNKLGINDTLKLDRYKIIVEEPTPFNEDLKDNPELKAKTKAMNKRIKGKQRLSDSTAPCYAELITTHIFYHKAMMYGSNLFTGWIYREFDGEKQTKLGKGQVKNPLEYFPPKTEEDIEKAQIELRDAYSKDFTEYVEKKVFKVKRKKRR